MSESFFPSWWILALRGAVALTFGLLTLFSPATTLLALVTLFAAYALVNGVLTVLGAMRTRRLQAGGGAGAAANAAVNAAANAGGPAPAEGRSMSGHESDWWVMLLLGLVSIGAGIITIMHPGLTALLLVLLIGANALVCGILEIVAAIRLRRVIRHEWLLMASGLVGIVFGVLVFLFPAAGALSLIALISAYALIIGALYLALSARLWARARQSRLTASGREAHAAGRSAVSSARVVAEERRIVPDRRRYPQPSH